MEIIDYLNKWMRLSALTENPQFQQIVTGLRLKHAVALYKLVKEKIAVVKIQYLLDKYKIKLSQSLKNEINAGVDFEQSHGASGSDISNLKIPHGAFVVVLKKFMFCYLTLEMYNSNEVLADYLASDTFIDCWPTLVPDNVICAKFPKSLLAANIYDAYQYTIQNVKKAIVHKSNNDRQRETLSKTSPSSSIHNRNYVNYESHVSLGGRRGHNCDENNSGNTM
ncbi:e3 ubiquitin-protein ligase [Gigaspora margarita]|uniref:E3 ubiquitin-protein ligase n=1 Tax=Gigaspora margarita TaxID=4874 RepID=A0A8H4B3R0_GIGMA|nr:e3 ubiquitin-protein ligase [Gigaspora margarita]